MKKNILIVIANLYLGFLFAQTPDGEQLVGLHNVPTTDLSSINNPVTGSLLYNPTDKKVYTYDGTNWVEVSGDSEKSDLELNTTTGKLTLTSPETSGNEVDLKAYVRVAPVKEVTANYT